MGILRQPLANVVLITKRGIPNFLEKAYSFILTKYIDKEGIFRMSGNDKSKEEMLKYIDATDDIVLNDSTNPFEVCNVITGFIREIPNHIFLDENCNKILEIRTKEDAKAFVSSLPYINRVFSSRFLGFIYLVTQHSSNNKMNSFNLSRLLSPVLIANPKMPTYLVPPEILDIIISNYPFIFQDVSALDEKGNWIEADNFKVEIGDILDQFFCQSTYGRPSLKPTSHEKEMKMCRKLTIEPREINELIDELLSGDSINSAKKYQQITPL